MELEDKIEHWRHWFNLWISGIPLQVKEVSGWEDVGSPSERNTIPCFRSHWKYRIKPREFEDGACYPVERIKRLGKSEKVADVVYYAGGVFYLTGSPEEYQEDDFLWIGEKLDDSLWEK